MLIYVFASAYYVNCATVVCLSVYGHDLPPSLLSLLSLPLFSLLLRLYVILRPACFPASHPWGASPIRLAVLQCVPTDLM